MINKMVLKRIKINQNRDLKNKNQIDNETDEEGPIDMKNTNKSK